MFRLCTCLMLAAVSCYADGPSAAILKRARLTVAQQLVHAWNYTCVQTTQRDYFSDDRLNQQGCRTDQPGKPRGQHFKRDRLRLDMAVSEGREIYSWHAEQKFTSAAVTEIVRDGPISSGNFFGLITNIFILPGTQFAYLGKSQPNDSGAYRFEYSVPLAPSHYTVDDRVHSATVPFHGEFLLAGPDYHLTSLTIVTGPIPDRISICLSKTTITYQAEEIAGYLSLIPAKFSVDVLEDSGTYTVSQSNYSECREFRATSALTFQPAETLPSPSVKEPEGEEWLPAGLPLRVRLRTPVDDRTSYVGDRVEGVLVNAVKLPGSERELPKGAVLTGIITGLAQYYYPDKYQQFSARFNRVSFGADSFRLNATLKSPFVVGYDSHFHLNRGFSAQWVTSNPPGAESDPSSQ